MLISKDIELYFIKSNLLKVTESNLFIQFQRRFGMSFFSAGRPLVIKIIDIQSVSDILDVSTRSILDTAFI
ncbi:hypothetical protein BpHYR1_026904 [Brachionus plicatilis]|uniref:Uncharacterized protein n=1 Tax=Brachionus plicatilis TaxID=10195 RepID=A0A3M7RNX9_BRAPC|nr:hypothetical protein BpHYR1_026904 [Brachionus plicatilis]